MNHDKGNSSFKRSRKLIGILILLCLLGILFKWYISLPTDQYSAGSLEEDLKRAKTIMWIGAHPDDELFTAGTFGYFTRNLHGHLVIVSLYYNPEYVKNNEESARFLGNADYVRIQEEMYEKEGKMITIKCKNWKQLKDTVRQLEEAGVKEFVKELILQYRPDIVFGFEPTNGFRHSCQHVSMAIIVDKAVYELKSEEYNFFDYYYVLNRDPSWFGSKWMDPPPVTDVIYLTDEMWDYKLHVFDIYSEFYPQLKNEEWLKNLQHKEWFRGSMSRKNKRVLNIIWSSSRTITALTGGILLIFTIWKAIEQQSSFMVVDLLVDPLGARMPRKS